MEKHIRNAGFTLIETMIWIAVFTMIMIAIIGTLIYFYRTDRYALEQASAIASGQRGIDEMVRTMRQASYSASGAYPIISFGPDEFTFYSNANSNASIEEVSYYISGSSLYEDVINPSGNPPVYTAASTTYDVSDYVRNIAQNVGAFSYYDASGNLITDYSKIGDVRYVTANLIIDVNPADQPGQLTIRSSAALRNIATY